MTPFFGPRFGETIYANLAVRVAFVAARRYVRISLLAPAMGVVEKYNALLDILNKAPPGLRWEFAVPLGARGCIVYREVENDEEFVAALEALAVRVGGAQHVSEVESPFT